ncbi:MAG TPA: serine/threonine protein kinase, partial [Acidimicrobiales bacterium]
MKCEQPGCTGTIEDGYCNVCGMAPAKSPGPTPMPVGTGPSTPTGTGTTTGTGRTGTRRTSSSRTRPSARGHLGAGLVEVPPIPYRDPASVIMASPAVAEDKRFCGRCGQPVGRSQDGKAGRTEGFCRNCGQPFSFVPKLVSGDLVAAQY